MDDTPLELFLVQVRIWRSKPFEERMRLGASADAMGLEAARLLAEAKSPGDPAATFLALHGDCFSAAERGRIADAIRARHVHLNAIR